MSVSVLVLLLVSVCVKESRQLTINPSNLNRNGQNVCSRGTYQVQLYTTSTATSRYTTTYTSCGFLWLFRCGRSRTKVIYRTVQRTRGQAVTTLSCCNGWQKSSPSSSECTKAICSQGCNSIYGSCVAPNNCQCIKGWTGYSCNADLDECATNNGWCDIGCVNTQGSYECTCPPGYNKNGRKCEDIDECQTLTPSPCSCGVSSEKCGATCTNLVPSFSCSCGQGFQIGRNGRICNDIDECSTNNGGCPQRCINSPGKYYCKCFAGFRQVKDSNQCQDIDECLSSNGYCSHNCMNAQGTYSCGCRTGFFLDSNGRTCSDHDECLLGYHGCQDKCNNYHGGYLCSCNADKNECLPISVKAMNNTVITIIPAGCDQLCHNIPGNYTCSCNPGYVLLYDGKRCRDINECTAGSHSCDHICYNTPGSYGCLCHQGYKIKPNKRSCEGLPCESIQAPPHGSMNCSGFVTDETCHFVCEEGYQIDGSVSRRCLKSSRWDGQRTTCRAKRCGRPHPPNNGMVMLPCQHTFGSTCRLDCMDGYLAIGKHIVTCRVNGPNDVRWDSGNFTCKEIIPCKPNPCRHGGECLILDARKFFCDCEGTGYEGDLCQKGLVSVPAYPKLTPGTPARYLVMRAKPDDALTISLNSTFGLTFQPNELEIKHPSSYAEFQATAHMSGIGTTSYLLNGASKHDFDVPEDSVIFVGRNIAAQNSIYIRLGLLKGDLPVGSQKKELEYYRCQIKFAFFPSSHTVMLNDSLTLPGVVHIMTAMNETIPLTLLGHDLTNSSYSRKAILKNLLNQMTIEGLAQPAIWNQSSPGCFDFHLEPAHLMEFIQNDAFPKSYLRQFTKQLPLWLKVLVQEDNDEFDIENTLAYLVRTSTGDSFPENCIFPFSRHSAVVFFRPTVNYIISVDTSLLSLSSKGSCFALDICQPSAFFMVSRNASLGISTMKLFQDMAREGWNLSFTSVGFTEPRQYDEWSLNNSLSPGHLSTNFSHFHYNFWWKGGADIYLRNTSSLTVNMKVSGEAFVFLKDINSMFTLRFRRPIKCVFSGSAEFNITLRALGQRFSLSFRADEIHGKAYIGGSSSRPTSECGVPQGFFLYLPPSIKPFHESPLSRVIQSYEVPTYMHIYHSVSGGHDISVQDNKNSLIILEYQIPGIKRFLTEVRSPVPELNHQIDEWDASVDKMLIRTVKSRRLLSSPHDMLQLKLLVRELNDNLYFISRAFDLLSVQLQQYKNRTGVENAITILAKLKRDLQTTISLSYMKSATRQSFEGFRFTTVAQVCHKLLCFKNMNLSITSLKGKVCTTGFLGQDVGLWLEGTALEEMYLSDILTYPAGSPLELFLGRDDERRMTSFYSVVNLFGLKLYTAIKLLRDELSFDISGPLFQKYEALLYVTSNVAGVSDWKSLVFQIEGVINKPSTLIKTLEEIIINETVMAVEDASRRLANAKMNFQTAKNKAFISTGVLRTKLAAVGNRRKEKEEAASELRGARLEYYFAKVGFNITAHNTDNILKYMCEIDECNYTCLNSCVIPDMCQDQVNVTYLERFCETVDKPIMVSVVQQRNELRSYEEPTFKTIYTGDCSSGDLLESVLSGAAKGATIGVKIGGPKGAVIGALTGALAGALFYGCSDTYERVPAEPKSVKYNYKIYEMVAVERIIKEVKCSSETSKTKHSGYGSPYPCCKQYGCHRKVIDHQCVKNNQECLLSLQQLKFVLDKKNETLYSQFIAFQSSAERLKSATLLFEKARIRHDFAVAQHRQMDAHMKRLESAVEVANSSMLQVRKLVDFGLRIAEAINTTNVEGRKVVLVGDMQFSLSLSSEASKRIVFRSNVSYVNDRHTLFNFLVDFDRVKLSLTSAGKTILSKFFGRDSSRVRRSASLNVKDSDEDFIDYQFACMAAKKSHLYFEDIAELLGSLVSSISEFNKKLSIGLRGLGKPGQIDNGTNAALNVSSLNATKEYQNAAPTSEFLEIVQIFHEENAKISNDSAFSWNETLDAWRAYLDIFTAKKNFTECSGTLDCIDYFFVGLTALYEFEDSPKALKIKEALPLLKMAIMVLANESITTSEAAQALNNVKSLLNQTWDNSVLCGGKPVITYSSQGELIVFPGESFSLNCTARDEAAGLKYAWRRNGKVIKESLEGTFHQRSVTKDVEGAYDCLVSNSKGHTASNVTVIKVHRKPRIHQHPKTQEVVVGDQRPVIFTCNATGQPSPGFHWFFHSSNSSLTKLNETKSILYIDVPARQHEGYYSCKAFNQHGVAVSKEARLDVLSYSIGLPRLLIALNISTFCSQASNSSNSSAQAQDPCVSELDKKIPSEIDQNLTDSITLSLTRSLNVSVEMISLLRYDKKSSSVSTLVFILSVCNEQWSESNFTSYEEIAEAFAFSKVNLLEKVKFFYFDVSNKTFNITWNTTSLHGDPDSIYLYPITPKCPTGQTLNENGYICANCPAGSYGMANETCVECPRGTYQPLQGQADCISCGQNLTTTTNGTVEGSDCIADCPPGSYSTLNRTCDECPRGTFQPSKSQITCIPCGPNLTTTTNGTLERSHCIANCPAGSYSTTDKTCAKCPLGTYQPSRGQTYCLSCGPNLSTSSNGAVYQFHCVGITYPSRSTHTVGQSVTTPPPGLSKTKSATVTSPPLLRRIELYFQGELLALDSKDKEEILELTKEEVSRFLGVDSHLVKKSEISKTGHGVKVILLINRNGVNDGQLQKLLNVGIDIEYNKRKMHFTGEPPAETPGDTRGQKSDEELPWKIPAIAAPVGSVFLIVSIVAVLLFIKRKRRSIHPATKYNTTHHENPTYEHCVQPKESSDNGDSSPKEFADHVNTIPVRLETYKAPELECDENSYVPEQKQETGRATERETKHHIYEQLPDVYA